MRDFDYTKRWQKLLTPQIVKSLTAIHEFKGEQKNFIKANQAKLDYYAGEALIHSSIASNKTADDISFERQKLLVLDRTKPLNSYEQSIAGYRYALSNIHANYSYLQITPLTIKDFHKNLYKYKQSTSGTFKTVGNIISFQLFSEKSIFQLQTVPAIEADNTISDMCDSFNIAVSDDMSEPLLIIPMFILDFICISPFEEGNEQLLLLLMILLFHHYSSNVGQFVSIEKLIQDSKEDFYKALQLSTAGWFEDENNYEPFVNYILNIITKAYSQFSEEIQSTIKSNSSKLDVVKDFIKTCDFPISKQYIIENCPGPTPSQKTVERALSELYSTQQIKKTGGGRGTKYILNKEI